MLNGSSSLVRGVYFFLSLIISVLPMMFSFPQQATRAGVALRNRLIPLKVASIVSFSPSFSTRKFSHLQSKLKASKSNDILPFYVRLATEEDIPAINQCNVQTLPENYSTQFYETQLMRFKRLSLVAETPERELIGYALGKIKMKNPMSANIVDLFATPTPKMPEFIGEVTSIAVHEHHRGKGVAKQLMTCLHFNVATQYAIDEMYLFVRVSNKSARQLYENVFQYSIDHIEPSYYLDGEDACYMKKPHLLHVSRSSSLTQQDIDRITLAEDKL